MLPRNGAKIPPTRWEKRRRRAAARFAGVGMGLSRRRTRVAAGRTLAVATLAVCLTTTRSSYASSLNQNMRVSEALLEQSATANRPQDVVVPPTARRKPVGQPVGPPKALATSPQPSAANTADAVNKLLAPRPGDPTVSASQGNFAQAPAGDSSSTGPKIYGRGEPGGGVLGFKIPIPADRGAFDQPARSSGAGRVQEPVP
jgi:hypothetical protein